MKKWFKTGRLFLLALFVGIAALAAGCSRQEENGKIKSIRVGLLLYRGDDTFVSTLRQSIEECAKEYEQETGIKVVIDVADARENQNTQNSQAERLISLEYDVLCVNLVDRFAATSIIDRAMNADIPVVFFNRQPAEEDMDRWEKLYYVGADAKESAVLQGNILVDAYKEAPSNLDMNGDGAVSYVLLEGESSHQDSLIRTEWSIQTLKDGGVPIVKLTGGIGNWERTQGSALMEQWLSEYPEEIELVIANNDDMALGAIDAIEREGILTKINVVGIDGTPPGIDALEKGTLFGTVQSDKEVYGGMIFKIAVEAALGNDPGKELELENGKYYWSAQHSVTKKQE